MSTFKAIAAVALVAALVAACSPTSPSAAPSSAASPAPNATPAAAPTQAGAPEPCATIEAANCPMPAGTYHASRIGGGLTFALIGTPWTNVAYEPAILSFARGPEWVVFMHGALNMVALSSGELVSDPGVAKLALDSMPGITVRPGNAVTIGGHDAAVIDVINENTVATSLWSVGETSVNYSLDPGAAVRIHWIDLAGTPFILVLEAPKADIVTYLGESQPVIDSIVFD